MIHAHVRHWFRIPFQIPLAALTLLLLAVTPLSAQEVDKRSNVVGIEILGRALLYSANYERHFNRLGVGAGVALWSISSDTVVIVPMYASYRPIGSINSLYLAG